MKLVIVESPAKAKTIQKYLGGDFVVKSSYGHVRDLPKSTLGVDVENNYEPKYLVPAKAKKVIAELKEAAKKADEIYFATDEDREGEAIAWHLVTVLKTKPDKVKRITFTEITKSAIQKAIEHPRDLDINLINAQQARRVLDRLVGYELSPLLWRKVRRGLSAGRVQSVAVRMICEREEEIGRFKAEEYWTLTADIYKDETLIKALLHSKGETKYDKLDLKNREQVDSIVHDLTDVAWKVESVKTKERSKTPPAPLTTSTLQQAAVNRLGFSSKKTMMLAQQLYEGIDVAEGPVGLITYMRTDSLNVSPEATAKAREVITSSFGKSYALDAPRAFTKKSKGAQEAHEAIRPTDPSRAPEDIERYVTPDQLKVYRLIWQRFLASQMATARFETVTADISAGAYTFRATGSTVLFDGYMKVSGITATKDEAILPPLTEGDTLGFGQLLPEQHFTQPPARYSEASLVKALEEKGIGRPSTYAPTIDTVQRREYVTKGDDKRFRPTEVGQIVNKLLTENFRNIVDYDFTAAMEENLDRIASGDKEWQPIIDGFYQPFHEIVVRSQEMLSKKDFTETATDDICPDCGSPMIIRLGRFGKFKACSKYPECKHTEPLGEEKQLQDELSGEMCPDCGKPLVVKRGRFGPFLGCSGYPECKHIKKIEKTTGVKCPACGQGEIVEKRSKRGKPFYACNRYPECKNAYWSKPTGEKCPNCSSLLVYGAKSTVRCSSKECGFKKELEPQESPASPQS
jgi:DNA topoisomerase-1